MRYMIDCQQTISGDLDSVWETWTDLASYTSWDPREEEMRLDTPFGVGATGFSKQRGGRPGSTFRVVRVEPKTRWVNQVPPPGGTLTTMLRMHGVAPDIGETLLALRSGWDLNADMP